VNAFSTERWSRCRWFPMQWHCRQRGRCPAHPRPRHQTVALPPNRTFRRREGFPVGQSGSLCQSSGPPTRHPSATPRTTAGYALVIPNGSPLPQAGPRPAKISPSITVSPLPKTVVGLAVEIRLCLSLLIIDFRGWPSLVGRILPSTAPIRHTVQAEPERRNGVHATDLGPIVAAEAGGTTELEACWG